MRPHSLVDRAQLLFYGGFVMICMILMQVRPISTFWWQASQAVITVVDSAVSTVSSLARTMSGMAKVGTLTSQLTLLEQENRKLWVQYGELSQRINESNTIAPIAASFSASQPSEGKVILSTDAQGWFVVDPTYSKLASGSAVLVQGVYLGKLETVTGAVASVDVLGERTPIPVRHLETSQLGTLRTQQGKRIVEFFDVIPSISDGQLIVTVADRTAVPDAIPICVVAKVVTNPADPVSRVVCRPLVDPRAGMYVDIVSHTTRNR